MNTTLSVWATGTLEYEIKVAFLYNFAKFVEWPDESFPNGDAPFIIGILGQDPFGKVVNRINGKVAQNREVLIKRFSSVEDIGACQILFISPLEKNQLSEIINALNGRHILTVSEMKNFTQLGGVVNFFTEKNKIRFEINIDSASQAGLSISSKLLQSAKIVK